MRTILLVIIIIIQDILMLLRVIFSLKNHGLWEANRVSTYMMDRTCLRRWVNCRQESYFLEFMYVYVARDFVGIAHFLHQLESGYQFRLQTLWDHLEEQLLNKADHHRRKTSRLFWPKTIYLVQEFLAMLQHNSALSNWEDCYYAGERKTRGNKRHWSHGRSTREVTEVYMC